MIDDVFYIIYIYRHILLYVYMNVIYIVYDTYTYIYIYIFEVIIHYIYICLTYIFIICNIQSICIYIYMDIMAMVTALEWTYHSNREGLTCSR